MIERFGQVLCDLDAAIVTADDDLDAIERTLTDGCAQALSLEAERCRLERQLVKLARDLGDGDTTAKARELSRLATRLGANASELERLRDALADLRRHAAARRVP